MVHARYCTRVVHARYCTRVVGIPAVYPGGRYPRCIYPGGVCTSGYPGGVCTSGYPGGGYARCYTRVVGMPAVIPVWWECTLWYTRVVGVYPMVYPGGMPPYCTQVVCLPTVHRGTPSLYHPGYTSSRSCTPVPHILPLMVSGCVERKPWAQRKRFPLGESGRRASQPPKV